MSHAPRANPHTHAEQEATGKAHSDSNQAVLRIHEAANQAANIEDFHHSIIAILSEETRALSARALELDSSQDTFHVICAYGKPSANHPGNAGELWKHYEDAASLIAPGIHSQCDPASPISLVSLPFATDQHQRTIYILEVESAVSPQITHSLGLFRDPIALGIHKLHTIDRLERSNHIKNQLITSTSHDLRNLLTAIAATGSYLHSGITEIGATAQHLLPDLVNMQRASDKMSSITSQLLDLTALETGRSRLDQEERNLSHDLSEYIALYVTTARKKQIHLEVSPPDLDPIAYVDPDRIARVFDNIISNAIKYTHAHGTVQVSWTQTPLETITHIQDSGVGMKPEELSSLFEEYHPLFSTPTSGESSTGLGLAIAKRIIDTHKGRIWAESTRGVGSRFSFALPRTDS